MFTIGANTCCRANRAGTTSAIQAAARDRARRSCRQVGRLGRLEDHRAVERRKPARVQAAARCARRRCGPTVSAGSRSLGRARGRVPVVALHRAAVVADDRAIDVMARAAVAAGEAVRVRVDELRFAARNGRALAVDDPPVDGQRRRFCRAAELDRRARRKGPTGERGRDPGTSCASRSRSASPAKGSSAVKRAMAAAFSTVARIDSSSKSAVLAWPRRWPM